MNLLQAIKLCRDHGYTVALPPRRRMRPGEIAAMLKLHPDTVSRKLGHKDCPLENTKPAMGPGGKRIQTLVPTPELLAFLKGTKKPPVRCASDTARLLAQPESFFKKKPSRKGIHSAHEIEGSLAEFDRYIAGDR